MRLQIADVQEQTHVAEVRHEAMQAQIADLQRRLGIAETATTSTEIRSVDWNRTLDPKIVRVSTEAHVPAEVLKARIELWLDDAGTEKDQCRLEHSSDPCKYMVIRFAGTTHIADGHVGKTLGSNRTRPTDGSAPQYKEINITVRDKTYKL